MKTVEAGCPSDTMIRFESDLTDSTQLTTTQIDSRLVVGDLFGDHFAMFERCQIFQKIQQNVADRYEMPARRRMLLLLFFQNDVFLFQKLAL